MEQTPLIVVVLVIDPKTDKIIRRHEVDFGKSRNRDWLRKLYVWAFTNEFIVEAASTKIDRIYALSIDFDLTSIPNYTKKQKLGGSSILNVNSKGNSNG